MLKQATKINIVFNLQSKKIKSISISQTSFLFNRFDSYNFTNGYSGLLIPDREMTKLRIICILFTAQLSTSLRKINRKSPEKTTFKTTCPVYPDFRTSTFLFNLAFLSFGSSKPFIFIIYTSSLAVWMWRTSPLEPAERMGFSGGNTRHLSLAKNS